MRLLAAWSLGLGAAGIGAARFDDIRTALGLRLEAEDLGAETASARPTSRAEERAETQSRSGRSVQIRAGRNGHYETKASINGRDIRVMVDTGATVVALTAEDAAAAGIFPREADFKGRVSTANGVARVAPVTLDSISIDDITVRNVRAVVAEHGRLETTLLGMSFLGQLTRAEMSRGVLTLQE